MEELIEQVKMLIASVKNEDQIFSDIARCMKKMRTALEEEGFSREEAVRIVVAAAGKK